MQHGVVDPRVNTQALEKWDGEARARSGEGGEHAVCGGCTDSVRQGFETLPDCDHESGSERRAVDPFPGQVLRL